MHLRQRFLVPPRLSAFLALATCGSVTAFAAIVFPSMSLLVLLALVISVGLFFVPKPALTVLGLFLCVQATLVLLIGPESSVAVALHRVDETILVGAICRIGLLAVWAKEWKRIRTPVLFLGAFLASGLVSAVVHSVPFVIAALGAFLSLKFGILVVLSLTVPWTPRDAKRLVNWILIAGPVLLCLGLLRMTLPNEWQLALATPEALSSGGYARGGFLSLQGPFVHPGVFGWAMAVVGCYGFAAILDRRRAIGALAVVSSIVGILGSLRRKPLGGLALGVATSIRHLSVARKLAGVVLLLTMAAGIWLFGRERVRAVIQDAIVNYADPYGPATARGLLYITGWEIAAEQAPLGVGFGRFGGYTSRLFYSPLYDEYGLSHVYGLSRENPTYMEDTYWPHILAETGWLGALTLLFFLLWLWRSVHGAVQFAMSTDVRILAVGAAAVLVEGVVESIAGPLFESTLPAFVIAIPIGMAMVLIRTYAGPQPPAV